MKNRTANKIVMWSVIAVSAIIWTPTFIGWLHGKAIAAAQERYERALAADAATLSKLPKGCTLTDLGPYRRARALYAVICDGRETQTNNIIYGRKHRSQVIEATVRQ